MAGDRSFTIDSATGIDIPNDASMRYKSNSPIAAAKKATSRLFKLANGKKMKQIRFVLRETTSGAGGSTYKYIGMRTEYDTPVVVSLNGKEITYKYKYDVKSCVQKR
jgi:hypothetical protein